MERSRRQHSACLVRMSCGSASDATFLRRLVLTWKLALLCRAPRFIGLLIARKGVIFFVCTKRTPPIRNIWIVKLLNKFLVYYSTVVTHWKFMKDQDENDCFDISNNFLRFFLLQQNYLALCTQLPLSENIRQYVSLWFSPPTVWLPQQWSHRIYIYLQVTCWACPKLSKIPTKIQISLVTITEFLSLALELMTIYHKYQ